MPYRVRFPTADRAGGDLDDGIAIVTCASTVIGLAACPSMRCWRTPPSSRPRFLDQDFARARHVIDNQRDRHRLADPQGRRRHASAQRRHDPDYRLDRRLRRAGRGSIPGVRAMGIFLTAGLATWTTT